MKKLKQLSSTFTTTINRNKQHHGTYLSIHNIINNNGMKIIWSGSNRHFSSSISNNIRATSTTHHTNEINQLSQSQQQQQIDPIFAEKQELFKQALLESVINKGNKDSKFYWACFSALASFGTLGFEVLFRMMEIPFIGLAYGTLMIGYVLVNRSISMISSGSNIAASMGGVEILPITTTPTTNSTTITPEQLRVYKIVEEIASSVNMKKIPKVYWIDCDEANAFASGYSINLSCITVTSGLASMLNDQELKSVIGHEMGHILNGDMKTGTLIAGMISAFALAVDLTRHLKSTSSTSATTTTSNRSSTSSGNKKDNSQAIIGMIILLSYVTMLAGKLLSVAVSRHREYASDAIASALTHPYYIRDALRKISNQHHKPSFSSLTQLPTSDSTNHLMFFEKEGLSSLFSTHPSLEERVANLDKIASFDVEDFRKIAKVSVMRDQRAKNTILTIMFLYCLFIIFLIYQIGEETVLKHLNATPGDLVKLYENSVSYFKGYIQSIMKLLSNNNQSEK